MTADSFLSSVIEVAIAIAGFAGIVAAIRHRNIAHWAQREQILLRMLLTASGMTITFALLPAVLTEAGVPASTVWRIGSLSLLVWQVAIWVHRARQFRAVGSAPPIPRVMQAWLLVALLLQVLNIYLAVPWPYLVGIFGLMLNAFTFFLLLLFGTASAEDAAAQQAVEPDVK